MVVLGGCKGLVLPLTHLRRIVMSLSLSYLF